MPSAGFYPIGASRIVFGRDGYWYADGERITNSRIALLFSRHLVQRSDGSYALVMGDEKATVEVEDTPWVVTQIDGDSRSGFVLTLNDQSQEPLAPGSLAVGPDNAFSCLVKGGSARARFVRSAHHALARHVEPAGSPGEFVIEIKGRRYPLQLAADRP
jgi:hypothetical protein